MASPGRQKHTMANSCTRITETAAGHGAGDTVLAL
jgi:hypothetical protein